MSRYFKLELFFWNRFSSTKSTLTSSFKAVSVKVVPRRLSLAANPKQVPAFAYGKKSFSLFDVLLAVYFIFRYTFAQDDNQRQTIDYQVEKMPKRFN
ncbi:hypothetical protein [Hymenobacter volaticus]|uniref:Uncharacterized protein n=1 Tax=Hymenobacter volaticus TaxID=2932254 RepID=A0ABY4GFR2_9BACT|nr:hypothetical protein [Hymenobacter volaticus]UOQ69635.1 hypothetical protein MUN86_29485 [Hymenobacter volaticus]